MDAQRWQKLSELFEHALEVPSVRREAWIAENCTDDANLRGELRRLLAADSGAESDAFLESPVDAPDLAVFKNDSNGAADYAPGSRQFGPYRLLRLIGQGGMGEVHLAERSDGEFEQRVALKLLPHPTPGLMQRFRHERQILARLEHSNIARLLDGGVGENGVPYFVMEFVDGLPITRYVDDRKLDISATLLLFLHVCEAVQYAHRNLVVHRDLKPSNILVAGDGTSKLLDFGIAKVLLATGESTQTVARVFTPDYAAPEQIRGETVTTATDVYALGVILYELLAGTRPYRLSGRHTTLEQAILQVEPAAPSAALEKTGGDTAQRRKQLRGDLDQIVLAALAKEPERRYSSAETLAADIRCYLDGRPILARGDSPMYRMRKFIRRNHVAVAAAAFVALALILGAGLALWQAGVARAEAARAEAQTLLARERAETAERVKGFMLELFQAPDPNVARGEMPRADQLLDRGAARIADELKDQPRVQAELYEAMAQSYFGLGRFDAGAKLLAQASAALATVGDSAALRARIAQMRAGASAELGRYADALAAVDQGRAAANEMVPPDAHLITRLEMIQGWVLRDLGRLEESEAALRDALGDANAPLDDGRSMILNNLAYTLQLEGKAQASITTYERAMAWREANLPADDGGLLWLKSTFGKSLRDLGYAERARSLLEATRPALLKEVGPDHTDLAGLDIALGQAQMDLGDTAIGYARIVDAVARSHRAAPMHNALWANAEYALAEAELGMGHAASAQEHAEAARAVWHALTGNDELPALRACMHQPGGCAQRIPIVPTRPKS